MKNSMRIFASIILLGNMQLQALLSTQPVTTPGEPVVATGGSGYIIVTQSTEVNRKKCLDKTSCYKRCAENAKKAGSKIPCISSATSLCDYGGLKKVPLNKLHCLCYRACDETANYETAYRDSTDLPLTRLNGFEGACSTIQNCITYYTNTLGWPFQCANIFCAYIDPTDGEQRDAAEQVLDQTKKSSQLFAEDVVDTRQVDVTKIWQKGDQLPAAFEQMGSEY